VGDHRHLDELGERKMIEEILRPRYDHDFHEIPRFGDDCAYVGRGELLMGGTVVATTDPCPEPMASYLGYTDLYYRGWLLAALNLSDLAAAGARPLGLLTSLILTNDTTVEQFVRLLDGIDECCRQCDTRVLGGNLKEADRIDLSATAIGVCSHGKCMSRTQCREGDLIVVIGDLGLFWAGVLSIQQRLPLSDVEEKALLHNILTPMPKVHIGQELAARSLLTVCLDNSDGLYPSLVTMERVSFPPEVTRVSSELGVDPVRLVLGWGDWQLIGCVDPARENELRELGKHYRVPVHVIGDVRSGRGVALEHKGKIAEMAPIDSQRFTKESWFTAGLEAYIDLLVNGSLWKDTN
jgi:thiamine-monophosphate kinase